MDLHRHPFGTLMFVETFGLYNSRSLQQKDLRLLLSHSYGYYYGWTVVFSLI